MTGDLIGRFRRWFEYEQDAHAKVLASFETVPTDRRDSESFRKALALFGHLVAARRVWLARMGRISAPSGPLMAEVADVGQVAEAWRAVEGPWREFLAELDDDALAKEVEYQSLDAGRFRSRLEDVLTQLFGHSWYHRGQIAMLVRASGGEPAVTDLIFWCREPVEASG